MSPWFALFLAGVFEMGFTTFLTLSDGFTQRVFTALFILSGIFSFWLLSIATEKIPLGTAYAVWTGIGAAGTAIIGIFFFKDPVSFGRILFLTLLVGSIVGLKTVSR